MLRCLQRANLKIHPGKAEIGRFKLDFLGHELSPVQITRAPKHKRALETFPSPTNVKELKQWMGLANYFVSHIKNRGLTMAPLLKLLRKGVQFEWTQQCEEAMRTVSDRVMVFCDFNKPLFLYTDASLTAIGAALVQEDPVNGLHWLLGLGVIFRRTKMANNPVGTVGCS